jgi:hypothetical protein
VWVFHVDTNNGDDNLCLVAVAVWECWTKWAVDQTTGENCLLGWATFPAEECARNFSCCIRTLFNVDGEWEKVDAITHATSGVCSSKNGGATNCCDNGALRLCRKLSGLERDGLV